MSLREEMVDLASPDARNDVKKFAERIPDFILERSSILKCRKGQTIVQAGNEVNFIFCLLAGEVLGSCCSLKNIYYDYASFRAPFIFGELELFSQSSIYRSTLSCLTEATILLIPIQLYQRWLMRDAEMLYFRACESTKYLLGQTRSERIKALSTARERLINYLIITYKNEKLSEESREPVIIRKSIDRIADSIGCSAKTVQRILSDLKKNQMISRHGHSLIINEIQAEKLIEAMNPVNV